MAYEVIILGNDGNVGSEMHGFRGKSCLKAAAEIAAELERLGIVTEVAGLQMKDTTEMTTADQRSTQKITED